MNSRFIANDMTELKRHSHIMISNWFYVFLSIIGIFVESTLRTPIFSIVVFCAYLVINTIVRPITSIELLFVLYLSTAHVMGVMVLETTQMYLTELGLYSSYVGSLSLIILYHIVFLTTCIKQVVNIPVSKPVTDRATKWTDTILVVMIVVCLIEFILAARNPSFEYGMDRFAYLKSGTVQKYLMRLLDLQIYLIPVVGIGFLSGHKKKSILYLLLYFLTAFLVGHKFGLFFSCISILLLAFIPKLYTLSRHTVLRVSIFSISVIVIMIGVVFLHNTLTQGKTINQNISYLNERLAQQGQLWWRTYDLEKNSPGHIEEIGDEFKSFYNKNNNPYMASYGIYKIMLKDVVNASLFYNKLDTGSRYAFSTPSTYYYYLKWPGLIVFAFLSAYIYSKIISALVISINNSRIVESIILSKFFYQFNMVITQSEFSGLFSYRTLVFIIVFIIIVFYRKYESNKYSLRNDWELIR